MAEEGLSAAVLTASRAVASVAVEVMEEAERAAQEAAACRAALAEAQPVATDVAWTTGWVPGRPPPPDSNAAPPAREIYADYGVHLTPSAHCAIRHELVKL